MAATFLRVQNERDISKVTAMLISNARLAGDITHVWGHIFHQAFPIFSHLPAYLLHNYLFDRNPKVPGRRFPVAYINKPDDEEPLRRMVLVEAMDVDNAGWDAEASYIYDVLKNSDSKNPTRKTLGILSAGRSFVLFEVIGKEAPTFLIGAKDAPSDLLDEPSSAALEAHFGAIKGEAIDGHCKAFSFPTDAELALMKAAWQAEDLASATNDSAEI